MSEDESGLPDFAAVLGGESGLESVGDIEEDSEGAKPEKSTEDAVSVPVACPDCGEGMSINTVVSQENRKRTGRSRYEAVCTDCQTAVIITLMKTVGDYNSLMGFDAPEFDWEIDELD